MKIMTIDEIRSLSGHRASRTTIRMTQLVREFMASGYEAVEIEPEDLGRSDFELGKATRNQVQSIRCTFKKVAKALGVEDLCGCTGPNGHVYIYRKDI